METAEENEYVGELLTSGNTNRYVSRKSTRVQKNNEGIYFNEINQIFNKRRFAIIELRNGLNKMVSNIRKNVDVKEIADLNSQFDASTAFGLEMIGSFTAEWISRIMAIVIVFILISESEWGSCNGSPSYLEAMNRLFFLFGMAIVFQIATAMLEKKYVKFDLKRVVELLESVSLGYRTYVFVASMIGSMVGVWFAVEGGMYRPNAACFREGRI